MPCPSSRTASRLPIELTIGRPRRPRSAAKPDVGAEAATLGTTPGTTASVVASVSSGMSGSDATPRFASASSYGDGGVREVGASCFVVGRSRHIARVGLLEEAWFMLPTLMRSALMRTRPEPIRRAGNPMAEGRTMPRHSEVDAISTVDSNARSTSLETLSVIRSIEAAPISPHPMKILSAIYRRTSTRHSAGGTGPSAPDARWFR